MRCLKAMDDVPREEFVEPITRDEAYADAALPISCGQTISQPFVVAYMTEHLRLRPHHRVLEIGTGSGYQAAVLSHLAAEVVTVERFRTLADRARLRLRRLARDNVEVLTADGFDLPDNLDSLRSHHGHRGDGGSAGRSQGPACKGRHPARAGGTAGRRSGAHAHPSHSRWIYHPKSCSRFASSRR